MFCILPIPRSFTSSVPDSRVIHTILPAPFSPPYKSRWLRNCVVKNFPCLSGSSIGSLFHKFRLFVWIPLPNEKGEAYSLKKLRCGPQDSPGSTEVTFVQNVQTGSVAHPTSHSMENGSRVKRPGREFDQSLPFSSKVKSEWSCASSAHPAAWSVLGQLYPYSRHSHGGTVLQTNVVQCTSVSTFVCPRKLGHRDKTNQC